MRALDLDAAFACGIAISLLCSSTADAAGTADVLPKPNERQQQVIDVMAKLNALLVPTREQFVAGSLSFIVHHEFGHFLIDEYEIPVLTPRQEDMADAYAIFEVAPYGTAEELQAPIRFWLFQAYLKGIAPIDWSDEHSLDHQRAFEIACFLAGRWPQRYAGLPEAFGASARRVARCERDSDLTQTGWIETLRAQSAVMIDKQTAVVTYEPAPPEFAEAKAWLSASGLLEGLANEIQRYKLPDWRIERRAWIEKQLSEGHFKPGDLDRNRHRVDVVGKVCGRVNAFYQPPPKEEKKKVKLGPGVFNKQNLVGQLTRPKIVVCYELVHEIRLMAEKGLPATKPSN
jgi:hypothetical protein